MGCKWVKDFRIALIGFAIGTELRSTEKFMTIMSLLVSRITLLLIHISLGPTTKLPKFSANVSSIKIYLPLNCWYLILLSFPTAPT